MALTSSVTGSHPDVSEFAPSDDSPVVGSVAPLEPVSTPVVGPSLPLPLSFAVVTVESALVDAVPLLWSPELDPVADVVSMVVIVSDALTGPASSAHDAIVSARRTAASESRRCMQSAYCGWAPRARHCAAPIASPPVRPPQRRRASPGWRRSPHR